MKPVIQDIDYGGERWFVVAVHYPTAVAAKAAWERVEGAPWHRPNSGLGILRLDADATRQHDPSLPAGRFPVVGCTELEDTARLLALTLEGGTTWSPNDWLLRQVIERRRAVTAFMPHDGGWYRARRPEPS